jgi:hypothetical protein
MRKRRFRRLREVTYFNRRFRPNPVSTKSWSDPPKLVPIVISVVALTVSVLSWLESHKGRLINEEINRPVLSLSNPSGTREIRDWVKKDDVRIRFSADLNNTGNSRAQIQFIRIEGHPGWALQESCRGQHPVDLPSEYEDLFPGQSRFVGNSVIFFSFRFVRPFFSCHIS